MRNPLAPIEVGQSRLDELAGMETKNRLERDNAVDDLSAALASGNDAAAIALLAKLTPIHYDRARSDAASKLGVRAETLDKAVKGQRQESSETTGGQAFEIAPPIPWDFPVSGSVLLDCVRTAFTARAKLPDHADVALSLWCLNTFVFDRSRVLPILALTSAQKRCGKTTTLSIVAAIVRCPLPASNISPAALFRAVEKWQPTLLIDEADSFVADDEALRGIVNSGHTKSAAFVIRTVGDDHEPRMFSTWCPKLFAGIGDLPDTIADRSINVRLKRKLSTEKVLPTRCDGVGDLVDIPRQCQRWAIDHGGQLKGADPSLPDVGNDRAKDNWRPLVAIADLCGGNWPVLVREAMKAMTTVEPDDNASIMLLTDIQDTFDSKNTDRIFTADLIDALIQLDDRPWPGWFRGKPITTHQVAKLLKPFGIFPRQIRYAGENKKGYMKADFADAAARYLPKNGETNETTKQAFINNGLQRHGNETKSTNVSDKNESNILTHNDCFVVSDRNAQIDQAGGLRQRGEI